MNDIWPVLTLERDSN